MVPAGIPYIHLLHNEDLTSISQIINESCDNTSQLVELLSNRGFSEADGMYASFFASDAGLADAFAEFAKESDWVDNPWTDIQLSQCEVVNIDGKDYIHLPVTADLKDLSKRDYSRYLPGCNFTGKRC